ncbi:MAG: hypothetical protein J6U31_09335 [Bacteroidales bacterium]|nr:hypothetical protein [Bacteroidales bacterium]
MAQDYLTDAFVRLRQKLKGVSGRMLPDPGGAEDVLQDRYRAGDTGLVGSYRHRDNIYTHNGLRLGVNAGIWYQSIGLIVGWHCRSIDRNNINIFRGDNQNVIHVGISIRY